MKRFTQARHCLSKASLPCFYAEFKDIIILERNDGFIILYLFRIEKTIITN